MSNSSKDHTSIRVQAPPGGQTNNNFGTSESEQSNANKKRNMESSIFGSNNDHVEPAPVNRQTRNTGNNISGTNAEANNASAGTLAGQYKQTQMKSNIFDTNEPTSTRHVSDKNKSNIFGIGDNDQAKQQTGIRQGRRDPNASRMGYNPINGESYSAKENVTEKQPDSTVKTTEEEKGDAQATSTTNDNANSTENGSAQPAPTNPAENGNAQAVPTKPAENSNGQKPVEKADNTANDNNAQKNTHTSVRVVHPPGGKSNGPLW